jgi:hypothetical protein
MRWLVPAIIALAAGGCSVPPVVIPSAAPCEQAGLRAARALDANARLAGAFVASVADVASWASHGYGSGVIETKTNVSSSAAPLDRVDVCYYDGDAFPMGGHPYAASGATTRPFDRLLVTVSATDGSARVVSAGFHEMLPLASPPHGP